MYAPTPRPKPSSRPTSAPCCGRWRPPSHRRPSSCGPSTNTGSGSSQSCAGCGRYPASVPSLLSSIAMSGATSSASCIPPLGARCVLFSPSVIPVYSSVASLRLVDNEAVSWAVWNTRDWHGTPCAGGSAQRRRDLREARYIADRSLLLALWLPHPDWTNPTLALATGRSLAWVKQWKARCGAEPHPAEAVWGRSRLHPPAAPCAPVVIERILQIRDDPPEGLRRPPGPRAILY